MSSKQCEKCGEPVDEAKAFCPGCGHAFVDERERLVASEFDTLGGTIQFGQTMYNSLLSDMGLNISEAPDPVNKAAVTVNAAPPQIETPENIAETISSGRKWLLIAIGVFIFLILVVLTAATLIFLYYYLGRG